MLQEKGLHSLISEKEKEVVLVQEYVWAEEGCQPSCLGSNPSGTICCYVPCARRLNAPGIGCFNV